MLLCLDVGNSHIYGGVFSDKDIKLRFRYASEQVVTSDQLGLFLKAVLRENTIEPEQISKISLCSVVPSLDYSITSACVKYFNMEPFILKPGVKTGIKLLVKQPQQLGADRIANAIAAVNHFPNKNIIIVDLGTAATYCAISADKEYLGGVIMPGLKIAMQSLHHNTAKLPPVEIVKPKITLGTTTEQQIQSGLFYGQLGASLTIIKNLTQEAFAGKKPVVIGTGGFAHLFEQENIFSVIVPDLILHGLRIMLEKNQ